MDYSSTFHTIHFSPLTSDLNTGQQNHGDFPSKTQAIMGRNVLSGEDNVTGTQRVAHEK